jgi:hypothetical protein
MAAKPATSVDEFVAGLAQPLRAEVESLRQVILSTAAGIGEELKWNAPSFYTGEHFATMRLHGKVLLQLILHLGAKKNAMPKGAIEDPAGLLAWLGPDRACIDFASPGTVASQANALQAILRQWTQHVPPRVSG